jgi:drug/metabolite transporter (DMT)-like permease
VAGAAVFWAAGATVARTLMDRGASVIELTEARAWIALLGIGGWLFFSRRGNPRASRPTRAKVSARFALLVVVFGLSLAIANFTYYLAISLLPVAVALVMQYTAPGLIVLWKAATARRWPSRSVLVALLLALAGVALVSELHRAGASAISLGGAAVAMASAVGFASFLLTGEAVEARLGSQRAVFFSFVVAGTFWVILQAFRGRPDTLLETQFLPGILFIGTVGTIAPFLLFVWGLGIVKASAAGIVSTLEPVSGAVLAYLFLGQTLGPLQLLGAASVIVGIGIVQWERPQAPEVMAERAAVE